MKPIYLAFSLIFNVCVVYAQDMIVTQSGDSINARIKQSKGAYTYFTFKYKGEIRNTLLSNDSIKVIQYNYYNKAEVPASYRRTSGQPDWRIAVSGGWSFRTAQIPASTNSFETSYLQKLNSGTQFQLECTRFLSESSIGIGIVYNIFYTSNSVAAIQQNPNGNNISGILSDNITIQYIAASVLYRYSSAASANALVTGISIGYTSYSDEGGFNTTSTLSGSTIGFSYNIGYDVGIGTHTSIGIDLSLKMASLYTLYELQNGVTQTINLDNTDYIGLTRFDLSLGLRFK